MFLGIEIGGTKLQLGVGLGDGSRLTVLERLYVRYQDGAEGILAKLEQIALPLIAQYRVAAVGIGFGGPVDADAGRTLLSHQVDGWGDFPLIDWCREKLGAPAVLGNDSDLAGLAEARFGAGRGREVVFYTNIGSGIGGALVIGGELYRGGGGIASELGHLRVGPQSDRPDQTVESIASGWGIAAAARTYVSDPDSHALSLAPDEGRPWHPEAVRHRLIAREEADEKYAADLRRRCDSDIEQLSAAIVAEAAAAGNQLAREIYDHVCRTYGWAIAQMITLLAPNAVVIGGGVALAGEELLLAPLREYVDRYVFPPLRETFEIVPAALGEEMVVHGALALAAECRG